MEVTTIRESQDNSILEVGYLRGSKASDQTSSKYTIRFLNENDLQNVIRLQEIVLFDLKDHEIYQPASKDILKEYLSKRNFTIGVETKEDIIGFSCINIPGEEEQNLGRDIGMRKEDLKKVAHIQFSFVHPGYRGNSFQLKLIKHTLEIIKNIGCCHVLCTVSPKNFYSLRNMFQNNLIMTRITTKYGGFLRCILYKNINIDTGPIWEDIVTIQSSDIEGQMKLLDNGFFGFDISKDQNEIMIHYGRSQICNNFS